MVEVYGRTGSGTKLAKAVGVSTAQVSRWESGENLPTYGMIERIAYALDIEPGWLAFGRGPKYIVTPIQGVVTKDMKEAADQEDGWIEKHGR